MGPHVDNFAVFLVQLPGAPKKWELEYNNKNANWQISKMEEYSRLSPNPSVRILEDYGFGDRSICSVVLEAGDMLFLPPRVGHHGLAMPNMSLSSDPPSKFSLNSFSNTLSIGSRSPSGKELLMRLLERDMNIDENFWRDDWSSQPRAQAQTQTQARGEITSSISNSMKKTVKDFVATILSDENENEWEAFLGEILTEGGGVFGEIKDDDNHNHNPNPSSANTLTRTEGISFSFSKRNYILFVNGEQFPYLQTTQPQILSLCENRKLKKSDSDSNFSAIVTQLLQKGYLYESY